MTLDYARKKHGLSLKHVAGLLGLQVGTVNNYCSSMAFAKLSGIEAEKLDHIIETAYAIAVKVMNDKTVSQVAIGTNAKHIIAMGYELTEEARQIFEVLAK